MPLLTFILLPWVKNPWFIAPILPSNSAVLYHQTTLTLTQLSYLPFSLVTKDPCGLRWSHLDNPGPCQGQLICNLNSICHLNPPLPSGRHTHKFQESDIFGQWLYSLPNLSISHSWTFRLFLIFRYDTYHCNLIIIWSTFPLLGQLIFSSDKREKL